MRVIRFEDPASFINAATPFLLQREAENNLLLGLPARIEKPAEALFCVVHEGERTVGAALQTDPTHNLLLSHMSDDAAGALAESLTRDGRTLPGVQGAAPAVQSFADRWVRSHDLSSQSGMCLGVYKLTRVKQAAQVGGEMRVALAEELTVVTRWMREFRESIGEHHGEDNVDDVARRRVVEGGIHLWHDQGRAVAIAAATGETPNGIRIGLVYTPPEFRKRGYASALVAALSQKLLDAGRRFCFLFTDMTNPTSNKIYQQIGYEFVGEQRQLRFTSSRS